MVELEAAERLGETILPGDPFTLDAGGDKKAAGTDDDRYYVAVATSAMYILDTDEPSDWGILPEGTKVVAATYCNLVYAPGRAGARVYTPSNPPIDVKVPVEHLLHASFKMEPITRTARPTGQLKFALENGGVVLSEHDHLQSMDALAWN